MNYVFFGTPEFAAIILEKLIQAGLIPAAVVANPDRPVGRKKIITPPPVKQLIANGKWPIEVLQPEHPETISYRLSAIRPEVFIVAAYAQILPKEILAIPRLGTIGIHPSLLPKYRGPTPIQTVILKGGTETGVTLYLMDEKIDHGATLAVSRLPLITRENYESLLKKLADLGAELLIATLPKFIKREIKPQAQDASQATYTKKFDAHDAFVDAADLKKAETEGGAIALEIDSKIRALNPEPGTWTLENGTRFKLLEAELKAGKLKLKTIQAQGKKPVLAS